MVHVIVANTDTRCMLVLHLLPQQPEAQELQSVLQPVGQHLVAAAAAEENRRSPCYNQNKVVAEALQGLSWLAYTGPNCGEQLPVTGDATNACLLEAPPTSAVHCEHVLH
jgi:hypothetical protein